MFDDPFWARVDRSAGDAGCWAWAGAHIPDGYGQVVVDGRTVGAHRRAYELLKGPIAPGLQLDHLCRNPRCVNPAHLEAVTGGENTRRGAGPSAANARKTHCDHGHEFTPENTYERNGVRNCRQCRLDWKQANIVAERERGRLRARARRAAAKQARS